MKLKKTLIIIAIAAALLFTGLGAVSYYFYSSSQYIEDKQ